MTHPYTLGRQVALDKLAIDLTTAKRLVAPALEVGGLATLAAPTVNDMVDPPWIQTEKRRRMGHFAELAGLGMLSLPSIYSIAKTLK